MAKRVLLINGHPDPRSSTFIGALAHAYAAGAKTGGHEVRRLDIGALDIDFLHSAAEFTEAPRDAAMKAAQDDISWAQHVVFIFPLWLAAPPAKLKAFLEQTFRYGFALPKESKGFPRGLLGGRSARVIATMGMPGLIYRLWFGAAGLRALESGVLRLSGFSPVRRTILGGMGAMNPEIAAKHIKAVADLGRQAL